MPMYQARLWIACVGLTLPYLVRLPGGWAWFAQYLGAEPGAFWLLGGFNAIAWGSILAISLLYRRPASLLAPCLLGFGFLAWAHASLDLASDAQAPIALIFIPIYALLPIAIGGVAGYVIDSRYANR